MNLKTILLGTAACALLVGPAMAQDTKVAAAATTTTTTTTTTVRHHHHHAAPAGDSRMDRLERMVEDQAAEIRDLKSQVAGTNGATAAPAAQQTVSAAEFEALQNQVYESAATTRSNAQVTIKKARPTIASADGKYSLSIRADVMGDVASFDKSRVLTSSGTQITRSGGNFRRAQIGIEGKIDGDFGYKFMYEFGGSGGAESGQPGSTTQGRIKEAFLTYKGFLDPFTFKIGAAPWPSNLNDATASDDLLFNERPSSSQLSRGLAADDGRYGAGFFGSGSMWNVSAFYTGDTAGKGLVDGQEAVVGRVALAPIQDASDNFTVHIGANGSWVFRPEENAANTFNVSFSDRPELRVWDTKLVNTGSINSKSAFTAGLEAAASWGPVMIQAEDYWYGINRRVSVPGVTDPTFSGWYVEGSWVLTGEPRVYSMGSAAFARPSPAANFNPMAGNWGAWEVAGRYSTVNLNHDDTSLVAGNAVDGGDQKIWSLGLNFYPNDNVKFMLDYQNVDVLRRASPILLPVGAKYNAYSFRTQITF